MKFQQIISLCILLCVDSFPVLANCQAARFKQQQQHGAAVSGKSASRRVGGGGSSKLHSEQQQSESYFHLFNGMDQPLVSSSSSAASFSASAAAAAASAESGQCPLTIHNGNLNGPNVRSHEHERVAVDSQTGRRSFAAKIVGIFSCLDSDSTSNDLTLDFRLAKPTIDMAVRRVNEKYSNMQFNASYRFAADICKHQQAAGHAADEYYVNGANYFVGPGCSESLASVGQLASYWNIPMCSTGYLPQMITARFRPPTLLQLSLSVESVGEMLLELFQLYKWRHLVIVTDNNHPLHAMIRDGLLEFFHTMYMLSGGGSASVGGGGPAPPQSGATSGGASNQSASPNNQRPMPSLADGAPANAARPRQAYYINITSRSFGSRDKHVDLEQVMLDAASYSRVMLLLARSETITRLLEAAHRRQMSKGQFVFIAHELFETQMVDQQSQQQSASSLYSAASRAAQREKPARFALDDKIRIESHGNATFERHLKEIFSPFMTISLRIPTSREFDNFRSQVADQSEREFNYRIQPLSLKNLYSLGLAAFIYDCVLLYADKVNFVLNQTNLGRIDGQTIFDLAAGHTFSGALTGSLTLNRAGQRVIDFTLNDFSPKNLSIEPIAHYSAIERRLTFLPNKVPHWTLRNQSVPRSDPRCRVDEIYCRLADDELGDASLVELANLGVGTNRLMVGVWLLVVAVLSIALTSSLIGFFVYRRFKIESELLNLWWSIKYEDIQFEEEATDALCDTKRSMSSLAISNESFNEQQRACSPQQQSGHPAELGTPSARTDIQSASISIQQSPATSGRSSPAPSAHRIQGVADHGGLNVCDSSQLGCALSASHSTSTLSVGGNSTSTLQQQQQSPSSQQQQQRHQHQHPQQQQAHRAGASKLIPLLNKQTSAASNKSQPSSSAAVSQGKQSSSKGLGGAPLGSSPATTGGAGAHKDPSISSQNKNSKLRLGTVLNCARDSAHPTKVGLYKASRVAAKHLNVRNLNINRQLLIELRQVRDLTHENLIKFIGLCPEEPNVAIVSELCTRGNLQDLLQNDTIRLDWPFRYSIINDIVDGLTHLHSSPIQFHGRLKSSNCVIDNRFVVKLTDFGLPTLMAAVEDEDEVVNPRLLLWTAPEHLRTKRPLLSGSQKGDIYSLAIVFQEIITRCGPFECEPILCGASGVSVGVDLHPGQTFQMAPLIRTTDASGRRAVGLSGNRQMHSSSRLPVVQTTAAPIQPIVVQHKQRLEPEEIVNLVRMGLSPPFRPYFRPDVASSTGAGDFNVGELIAVVQGCWLESAPARPTIASVKQQIKKMRRGHNLDGANLMDNLLQRMERYTDNLESLVEQKTAELMEEKKRSEELLYEMLPRFVVDQLKYGHSVTPEAYEAVTISFSDIKDFTSIAAQSSPIEVVNLLNQLYTEFDDCIAQFDVYKVETIGDAYMVVSGLPVRNGDLHAKEIAEMSLALLELIRNFDIVHLPHVNLELRIGIHSGPVASGVVGTRMFRYCLFGDTVNTASRMESHGEPMRIHISEDTANILARFQEFHMEPRGQVEIKGKGPMNTFWLTAK